MQLVHIGLIRLMALAKGCEYPSGTGHRPCVGVLKLVFASAAREVIGGLLVAVGRGQFSESVPVRRRDAASGVHVGMRRLYPGATGVIGRSHGRALRYE